MMTTLHLAEILAAEDAERELRAPDDLADIVADAATTLSPGSTRNGEPS